MPLCHKNHNLLIYIAVAIALGILLGFIFPMGFLVFVLGLVVIGIGVLILFT